MIIKKQNIFLIVGTILAIVFNIDAQRIEVKNNKFVVEDQQILLNGANTPWIVWDDFGGGYNSNDWDTAFQKLKDARVNCTRVWISCSGDVGININNSGYISGVTVAFRDDIDSLMAIAKSKKIYLMVALTSFDSVYSSKWWAWREMYKSDANRESFINNLVIPFVNRYKGNPYFFALEAVNEIEWVFEGTEVTVQQVQDLVARTANAVHENSKVLFCQGTGAGPKYHSDSSKFGGYDVFSDYQLSLQQTGAYLDFFNMHHYEWMSEWWVPPYECTPSYYELFNKPAIIGEFPAKGSDGYSPLESYQHIYSNGWQGAMAWTSNGVDTNGNINDMDDGTKWLFQYYPQFVYPLDRDLDGIPDKYELLYSGSPTNMVPSDDPDYDGMDNMSEWIAQTNPTNSESYFRIDSILTSSQEVTISWISASNRIYSVEWAQSLTGGYKVLTNNIPYPVSTFTAPVLDKESKFYRLKVSVQEL